MIKASCFLPCTPQMIGKEMAPVARAEVLGQISFGASPVGLGRLEARQHDIRVCCPVPVVGKWEPCPRHFQIRLFVQFCSTTLLLAGVAMLDSSVRTKKKDLCCFHAPSSSTEPFCSFRAKVLCGPC